MKLGWTIPEGFATQVAKDKTFCEIHGHCYEIVLLSTIGTAFTRGRDDVFNLRQAN